MEGLILYVWQLAHLATSATPPTIVQVPLLLLQVGALASLHSGVVNRHDGDLTFLGQVLAALPVDIRFGKLMMLGHVFGLLEETIIIGKELMIGNAGLFSVELLC